MHTHGMTAPARAALRAVAAAVALVVLHGCTADDDRPELPDPTALTTEDEEPPFTDTIVVTDDGFAPARAFTGAGRELTVRNDGTTSHTMTAWDGSFDIRLAPGQQVTIEAPDPGAYPFSCELHPELDGDLETL